MTDISFLINVAALVIVCLCFGVLVKDSRKTRVIRQRLKRKSPDSKVNRSMSRMGRWVKIIGEKTLPKGEDKIRLKKDLACAGYRHAHALELFCGIRMILFGTVLALALLCVALMENITLVSITMAFAAISVSYSLLPVVLKKKVKKRKKNIFRELPDTLDLMVLCIEAGLGFEVALLRVSKELRQVAPILSREFAQYFYETRGGVARTTALGNIKRRNNSPGLDAFVEVVLQSLKFGTDIAGALRIHSESMRTERHQIAEEKGAKIAVKLTLPLVFLVLPSLMIVILGPAVLRLMDALIN